MDPVYKEYRCSGCRKLLFKGILVDSEVEIKCKRCGNLETFNGVSADSLICFVENCPGRITKSAR